MTPQQEIANFFQEFNRQKHSSSSDISSSVAKLSSPIRKAITMAIDENHITNREAHIHCSFQADTLQVSKEYIVDFQNLQQNGLDLRTELAFQRWECFSARLHGYVYEALVKEFWRQAEHD